MRDGEYTHSTARTFSLSDHPWRSVGHVLTSSAAFRQQKQLVYGTLDSQNDLQRAIVQVSNDVKSAEAVSQLSAPLTYIPSFPQSVIPHHLIK